MPSMRTPGLFVLFFGCICVFFYPVHADPQSCYIGVDDNVISASCGYDHPYRCFKFHCSTTNETHRNCDRKTKDGFVACTNLKWNCEISGGIGTCFQCYKNNCNNAQLLTSPVIPVLIICLVVLMVSRV